MNRRFLWVLLTMALLVSGMSMTAGADWITNPDGTRSYQKTDGSYVKGGRVKIGKYYYYFDAEGKMVTRAWVEKRYFKKNGRQAFSAFVNRRYVGKNGKYVTGLKKINGYTYYFDPQTGYKVTNKLMTINGKSYYFGKNGRSIRPGQGTLPVEDTYFEDPEVSDETLLASIIYCEAGNQPYDGQLAVGIVITNRMRSPLFPSSLREVIYSTDQFEPARNGSLTRALQGKMAVSETSKKAAARVMEMYRLNHYKVTNAKGKKVSMKNYLFFMTPAAYKRLGLKSKVRVLWDHVFFKTWS